MCLQCMPLSINLRRGQPSRLIVLRLRVSVNARDFEPIRYSLYADECCQILEGQAEYPSDKQLVHLIRITHMGSKIARTFTQDEWDASSGLSAPVGACVRALNAELQSLKATLPSGTLFTGKDVQHQMRCFD